MQALGHCGIFSVVVAAILKDLLGHIINHKELYREEGLSVRRRRGRKRSWQSDADARAAATE